jgi:outer membrane protein OmpA-like peptidoglycan-associated protein
MNFMNLSTCGVVARAIGACATAAPPAELVTARESYARAQKGPAAKYNPADLDTAHKAVIAAENSFEKNGDTQQTRDLAYVAERRSQLAEVRANTTEAGVNRQQATDQMHSQTAAQLGQTKQQLAQQTQAVQTERDARIAAEKRASEAAANLAKVGTVKQEPRGMVITLSGGVLFASGKSDLLGDAQSKLNTVAEALTQQDPESTMVVEGHTDSQGKAAYNQDLSQRRAQAVRDYLVSRGVAQDRVTAQGFGSTRSIADNTSAEGRANNRRVEIVVAPKAAR